MVRSDESPIRVGLIGYGYVGKTFHAPLIRSVPGLELTMVASSQPEAVLKDIPRAQVLRDPMEVVVRPELDLIVIASPNDSHFPLTAAALQAGKHVVCDKPFTLTLAESEALADLAQQQGKLLSVFHNRRWDARSLPLAR
jgi:predicted dehydrogenase